MKSVIEARNISKKYKIVHSRGAYLSLRDILGNILKSPFKFIKAKTKSIAGLEKSEEFWALKDINFDIEKGDVVGIIGRNGAGKSTLLKILSQITPPTTGEITIKGRVGSLLEVGTGFHQELTGRENIFLNGAILGMTKKEIALKFDQIVEFSGIEKFLDTPVKYYSSGMYVRLAFAVAAHMEPDILIIDEVLAVGDAEFQKKCLGKIDEIAKKDNRTVLIVSHNIGLISNICSKVILLESGRISSYGPVEEVTLKYFKSVKNQTRNYPINKKVDVFNILSIEDMNNYEIPWTIPKSQEYLEFKVNFNNEINVSDLKFGMGIDTSGLERIFTAYSDTVNIQAGKHSLTIKIKNQLSAGTYFISLVANNYFNIPSVINIEVIDDSNTTGQHATHGIVTVESYVHIS